MNKSADRQTYYLYDNAQIAFEPPDDGHSYFFGYYDKSPFDATDTLLLTHRTDFDGRPITADDVAEVGYWNIETGEFTKIGITRAFNWQQGSHLQWMPPDFQSRIIYNDRRDGRFVSVVFSLETGQETVYPCPIYAIHPSGRFALAANYERLYFCRPGYNYMGVINEKWNVPIHEEDGIYKLDFQTGEISLLIRTRDIVNFAYHSELESCDNWLEHMMWNPSGTRFAFLHRWDTGNGGHKTRLFTADADGQDLFMFPDVGFYSHMNWKNDQVFTIWALVPSGRTKAMQSLSTGPSFLYQTAKLAYQPIKMMLGKKRAAQLVRNAAYINYTDKSEEYATLGKDVLPDNGHNTWSHDERYMLTDTYQDDDLYRHVWIYDSENNTTKSIGKFYSLYNDSVYRADLHPRWSRNEKLIAIDSAHSKYRKTIVITT